MQTLRTGAEHTNQEAVRTKSGAGDDPLVGHQVVPDDGHGPAARPAVPATRMAEIEWLATLFPLAPPRGTRLAVMFTDISGFTSYAATHGDRAAGRLLRHHDAIVLPAIRHHSGRLVKRLGDGLMVVFDGAADALSAALAIQDAATRRGRVALRIGIHVGLVRGRDGDLIGHDVNVASRITDRAPRGGILVSGAVRAGARGVAASFQPARPLAIAARRPIGLFRVDPAGVRASRTDARTNGNGRRAAPRRTPSSRRPS